MARKATIYISDDTSEIIGKTGKGELSSRIAACLARYAKMSASLMPVFTRDQWCAIFEANNGTDVFGGDGISGTMIWANVADSPGLGEKWSIDQDQLVAEMRALSEAELLAVNEACVRFWQISSKPTDKAIKASGARVSG